MLRIPFAAAAPQQRLNTPHVPENAEMRKQPEPPNDLTPNSRLTAESLHEVLGFHLALATIVTDRVFDQQVRVPLDLRKMEFTLLALVRDNPGATPARLAKALVVTPASVTMMVDRMSEMGLLRREASTSDRRAQHLFLTPKGERTAVDAVRRISETEQQALAELSFAERVMLIELLRKVARAR